MKDIQKIEDTVQTVIHYLNHQERRKQFCSWISRRALAAWATAIR